MLLQNVSFLPLNMDWGHVESEDAPEIASGVMTGKKTCMGKINNRNK